MNVGAKKKKKKWFKCHLNYEEKKDWQKKCYCDHNTFFIEKSKTFNK